MGEHLWLFVIWMFILIYSVCCVEISLSPASVVLQALAPAQFSISCSIPSGTPVKNVIEMKIERNTGQTNDQQFHPIADATSFERNLNAGLVTPIAADIARRNPTPSGSINTENPIESRLTLTFNATSIECNDVGTYRCLLSYRDTSSSTVNEDLTQNLTVVALPLDLTMDAKKNGIDISKTGSFDNPNVPGSISNPVDFTVGDEVELTCRGNIGSDKTTTIKWKKTNELNTDFAPYPSNPANQGVTSDQPVDCQYSRTDFMKYNVTLYDRNRPSTSPLAFQCYADVGSYETPNPPSFYINVLGENQANGAGNTGASGGASQSDDGNAGGSSDTPSDAGVISGTVIGSVVVVVIIVVLVYFLWYRQRSGGDVCASNQEMPHIYMNQPDQSTNTLSTPQSDHYMDLNAETRGNTYDIIQDSGQSHIHGLPENRQDGDQDYLQPISRTNDYTAILNSDQGPYESLNNGDNRTYDQIQ